MDDVNILMRILTNTKINKSRIKIIINQIARKIYYSFSLQIQSIYKYTSTTYLYQFSYLPIGENLNVENINIILKKLIKKKFEKSNEHHIFFNL